MTVKASVEDIQSAKRSQEADRLARATALVALGNISSRILGLVREIILSNIFGASLAVDAFKIATIVPRGLYDLLIGGHVNSALVPVLSEHAERHDEESLWQLVSALLNLVVIIMAILVIGIEVFAPWIIEVVASGEQSAQILEEATALLQITAPALLFLSLFAVLSSLLYALRRFALPALAASVFNLTIVLITLIFERQMGITAAAVGWLLGAILQMALQWAGLRGTRIGFRLVFWHPAIRTVVLLYTPVMFSLALDVLINRPFSYNLATRAGEGSVSYMDWATTLMQFPHGLVATAISIAVLPTLSRQAYAPDNLDSFKDTLGLGLRLTLSLILPATLGLIVLANPVVRLIFEHGAFNATDTAITAFALRLYLVGLPFASIDLLLVFAFYARQDTLTPALIGLLSLLVYMITAIVLLPYYSFFALMIADSMKHLIHAGVSGWLLARRMGGLGERSIWKTGIRASLAAVMMAIAGFVILQFLESTFNSHNLIDELIVVIGAGGVSGLVYLGLAQLLGISEIQLFFRQLRQRL